MADNPYEEMLQAAELMFDDDSEECVRLAKLNLSEPGLPAYYDIQNRILISTASEYWNEAHEWRQDAHRAYKKFHTRALWAQDTATLESLKYLPEQLEELDEIVEGYLTEIIDKEYEGMPQTPPEERLRIYHDGETSDVSNDEAEDEPIVETEQKEFILSFRGGPSRGSPSRAAPSRAAAAALDVTATSTPGFLRGTASSVAKKRGTPTEFDTRVQKKQGKEEGG